MYQIYLAGYFNTHSFITIMLITMIIISGAKVAIRFINAA